MNFFQTSLILATVIASAMAMFENEADFQAQDNPGGDYEAPLTGNADTDYLVVRHSLLFLT